MPPSESDRAPECRRPLFPNTKLPTVCHWCSPRVRDAAAEEMRTFDGQAHPEIAAILIEVLQNDQKPTVRAEAAQSLGKLRPITLPAGQAQPPRQRRLRRRARRSSHPDKGLSLVGSVVL